MTKSELKTGMIVTQRDGCKFMVFENAVLQVRNGCNKFLVEIHGQVWSDLEVYYNEDMTSTIEYNFDIMKVELCQTTRDLLNPERETVLLWERKEKKRYTYAQLREILGEEFEVVG